MPPNLRRHRRWGHQCTADVHLRPQLPTWLGEAAHVDVEDQAHADERGQGAGAAIAHEREGDDGDRHDAHRHPDVLEHLEEDTRQHADARTEEHKSKLQSLMSISYTVVYMKKT